MQYLDTGWNSSQQFILKYIDQGWNDLEIFLNFFY